MRNRQQNTLPFLTSWHFRFLQNNFFFGDDKNNNNNIPWILSQMIFVHPPSLRFMCVFYFVVSLDYSRPLWCRQTKTKNTRFLFSDSPSWRITCVCFFLIFFFTCSFIFYFYKYAGSVPSFFFDTIIFSSYSEPLGQYEILVLPIDFVRFSCKSSLAPKIFIFFFLHFCSWKII